MHTQTKNLNALKVYLIDSNNMQGQEKGCVCVCQVPHDKKTGNTSIGYTPTNEKQGQ